MYEFFNRLSDRSKKLLCRELLYNDLFGVNLTDSRGKVLFINDVHSRITGHNKSLYFNENGEGKNMYDLEKEGTVSQSAAVRVMQSGKEVILRQEASGGKIYEVRGIPVYDENEHLILILNILTDLTELVRTKEKAAEMEEYTQMLKKVINKESNLIYQSHIMHQVVEKSKKVAEADVTVLITGPSGVGKEHIANIVHENSKRHSKPFVKINCAAIPEQLLESELFGYEPGAFTGGDR